MLETFIRLMYAILLFVFVCCVLGYLAFLVYLFGPEMLQALRDVRR